MLPLVTQVLWRGALPSRLEGRGVTGRSVLSSAETAEGRAQGGKAATTAAAAAAGALKEARAAAGSGEAGVGGGAAAQVVAAGTAAAACTLLPWRQQQQHLHQQCTRSSSSCRCTSGSGTGADAALWAQQCLIRDPPFSCELRHLSLRLARKQHYGYLNSRCVSSSHLWCLYVGLGGLYREIYSTCLHALHVQLRFGVFCGGARCRVF